MTLKLITAPAVEPVTLALAKVQCRVDSGITADDDLITSLIVSARQEAEHYTGRALITQTWERVLDAFPDVEIELGMPPVIAITSVTYIDGDGVSTVLGSSNYTLDADREPGWLLPAQDVVWPETLDTANAVRVRYTAGYGASASDVPAAIKDWILNRVATLYKFREHIAAGVNVQELPNRFADRLLDRYRAWSL